MITIIIITTLFLVTYFAKEDCHPFYRCLLSHQKFVSTIPQVVTV